MVFKLRRIKRVMIYFSAQLPSKVEAAHDDVCGAACRVRDLERRNVEVDRPYKRQVADGEQRSFGRRMIYC